MHRNREEQVMSRKHPSGDSHDVAPQSRGGMKRRDLLLSGSSLVAASALSATRLTSPAQAQQPATAPSSAGKRTNIVVIMGDDIGIWNLGAYHPGVTASRTPTPGTRPSQAILST